MELLPAELRARLPPLYSQQSIADPVIYARFFTRISDFTWYIAEGSPRHGDFLFFGYLIGLEREWGYFALSELQGPLARFHLPIERDLHFTPMPMSQALATENCEEQGR